MARRATFRPNRAGIKAMGRTVWMQKAMLRTADAIAEKTGHLAKMRSYSESMEAEPAIIDGMAGARAFTRDSFAHLEEFGSVNWAGTAPMRRAISSLGLRRRFRPS